MQLKFTNNTFRPGLNVTVRDGRKWLDTDGKVVGCLSAEANIVSTKWYPDLKSIPQQVHNYNHDPCANTVDGLVDTLDNAYGIDEHGEDGYTVVMFEFVEQRGVRLAVAGEDLTGSVCSTTLGRVGIVTGVRKITFEGSSKEVEVYCGIGIDGKGTWCSQKPIVLAINADTYRAKLDTRFNGKLSFNA